MNERTSCWQLWQWVTFKHKHSYKTCVLVCLSRRLLMKLNYRVRGWSCRQLRGRHPSSLHVCGAGFVFRGHKYLIYSQRVCLYVPACAVSKQSGWQKVCQMRVCVAIEHLSRQTENTLFSFLIFFFPYEDVTPERFYRGNFRPLCQLCRQKLHKKKKKCWFTKMSFKVSIVETEEKRLHFPAGCGLCVTQHVSV